MKHLACLLLLALAGCANKQTMGEGDLGRREPAPVHEAFARQFGDRLPPPRDVAPVPPASAGAPAPGAEIVELREEVAASSNQTQQSLDGLGLQVGKLSETFKLVEAELRAYFDVKLTNHQSATASALALMLNQWKAEFRADFQATFDAELEARNQQLAALQATVSEQRNQISAARDAHVQQIQFTAEMRDTLIKSYDAHVAGARWAGYFSTTVVSILTGAIVAVVTRLSKTIVAVDNDETKRLKKGVTV